MPFQIQPSTLCHEHNIALSGNKKNNFSQWSKSESKLRTGYPTFLLEETDVIVYVTL